MISSKLLANFPSVKTNIQLEYKPNLIELELDFDEVMPMDIFI